MGILNNLLELVQATEAAGITGGALSQRYVWPVDERLAMEYYESAARQLCWLSNEDPEFRCEFVGEAGTVVQQAQKVVYWVPRWETLVTRLREFDLHWLALGGTVEVRAAILQRRTAATSSPEPEQPAAGAEPGAVH